MPACDGLMQGGSVRMESVRVVPVWIFTRIEEQAQDLDVAELRGQRQSSMARLGIGTWQHTNHCFDTAEAGRRREVIDARAAPDQRLGGLLVAEYERGQQWRCPLPRARGFDIGASIEQRIDQRYLDASFGGVAA